MTKPANDEIDYDKVLSELKELVNSRSLSDEALKEMGCTTREEIGVGGDYSYGIVMVPEELVFKLITSREKRVAEKILNEVNQAFCNERLGRDEPSRDLERFIKAFQDICKKYLTEEPGKEGEYEEV